MSIKILDYICKLVSEEAGCKLFTCSLDQKFHEKYSRSQIASSGSLRSETPITVDLKHDGLIQKNKTFVITNDYEHD